MKKILFIDDKKDFRSENCQFLIENDFNLMEAVNGLQFSKKQYLVLIFCDIELYNLAQYISYSLKKISQMGAGILLEKTVGFSRILEVIKIQLDKDIEDFPT